MKTAKPIPRFVAFLPLLVLLAGGCLSVPLASSRQSISSRKTSDFEFVDPAQPTRSDVEKKLGKPNEYFPDLRVSVYAINTVTRHRYYAFLGIVPVHFFRPPGQFDIGCILFDEEQRARCSGVMTGCYGRLDSSGLRLAAEEWVGKSDYKGHRKNWRGRNWVGS